MSEAMESLTEIPHCPWNLSPLKLKTGVVSHTHGLLGILHVLASEIPWNHRNKGHKDPREGKVILVLGRGDVRIAQIFEESASVLISD